MRSSGHQFGLHCYMCLLQKLIDGKKKKKKTFPLRGCGNGARTKSRAGRSPCERELGETAEGGTAEGTAERGLSVAAPQEKGPTEPGPSGTL